MRSRTSTVKELGKRNKYERLEGKGRYTSRTEIEDRTRKRAFQLYTARGPTDLHLRSSPLSKFVKASSTLFQGLLARVLSWSELLCQDVSLPSSGSPRCSAVHHSVIPFLVLKHGLLARCISTYRSQKLFSQGSLSRIALPTATFLLLG